MEESSESITISAAPEDLALMFQCWPDNFASLFEMGVRTFERLFNHRPKLKMVFGLPDDESWRKDERIKKIVLALEQTLVQAVATFADPDADPRYTPLHFAETLQDIGGLHRAIVPSVGPDNFELLFKLLPEVIADVVSSRRKEGPLPPSDRLRLLAVWTLCAALMSRHFVLGWERRIVPKTDKFSRIYRSEKRKTSLGCRDTNGNRGSANAVPQRSISAQFDLRCSGGALGGGVVGPAGPFRGPNAGPPAALAGPCPSGPPTASAGREGHSPGATDEIVPWRKIERRGLSAPLNLADLHFEVGSPPT